MYPIKYVLNMLSVIQVTLQDFERRDYSPKKKPEQSRKRKKTTEEPNSKSDTTLDKVNAFTFWHEDYGKGRKIRPDSKKYTVTSYALPIAYPRPRKRANGTIICKCAEASKCAEK